MIDETRVKHLQKVLDLNREQALTVIADDEAIDKGIDLFPLTDEQKKVEKKMRLSGKEKGKYTMNAPRQRKVDNDKHRLIEIIAESLGQLEIETIINNPEREIEIVFNERRFKITLSAPRK